MAWLGSGTPFEGAYNLFSPFVFCFTKEAQQMVQQRSNDIALRFFSHILSDPEKALFLSQLGPERESHLSRVLSAMIEKPWKATVKGKDKNPSLIIL